MAGRLRLRPALRRYAHSVQRRATPGFAGPYDAIPDIVAAYGMRRLLSAYEGPILRLRRDSDQTEQDFGYTANGDLDTAAVAAFVGAGSGYITTWYDQSGNGNHAVQTTAASQPLYVASGQNGRPVARFDGADQLLLPGSATLQQALPVAALIAFKSNNTTSTPMILSSSRSISAGNHKGWWLHTGSQFSGHYGDNTGNAPTARRSKVTGSPGTNWRVGICVIRGATDMMLRLDGADAGGSYSGSGGTMVNTGENGQIGDTHSGDLAEIVIAYADWDAAACAVAEGIANNYWQVYA